MKVRVVDRRISLLITPLPVCVVFLLFLSGKAGKCLIDFLIDAGFFCQFQTGPHAQKLCIGAFIALLQTISIDQGARVNCQVNITIYRIDRINLEIPCGFSEINAVVCNC